MFTEPESNKLSMPSTFCGSTTAFSVITGILSGKFSIYITFILCKSVSEDKFLCCAKHRFVETKMMDIVKFFVFLYIKIYLLYELKLLLLSNASRSHCAISSSTSMQRRHERKGYSWFG